MRLMTRYIIVSLVAGVLFGVMDGIIYANPWAAELFEVYKPIAKTSVNAPAGIAIDLTYGLVMAGLFLLLYRGLPGRMGLHKGLSFALIAWFFRVLMSAASAWMTLNIPPATLVYSLVTGLGEMVILSLLFGLTLKPQT